MQRNPSLRPLRSSRLAAIALIFATAGAALFSLEAQAARRARKQTVLILRVEGTAVTDAQRRALTAALAKKASKYAHYRVAVSKTDLVEEMFEFECTEAGVACLSKIGKKYRANLVIYSEIKKVDGARYDWSLRVVELKSRHSPIARVAQSTVRKLASLDKSKLAAASGLLVLIGPVDLPHKRTVNAGTLHVRLIGGGVALVYINEKLAGRSSLSGLKVKLQPGKYTVKVVRAGYKDWTQILRIRAGRTLDRIVELDALPRSKSTAAHGRRVAKPITGKWWFWAGIASAGVAVAVTVWAVTRDGGDNDPGNAAFSLDSNDAHLDPVFGGG